MDIKIFDVYQETISALELIAQSNHTIQQGRVIPAKIAFDEIKKKIKETL